MATVLWINRATITAEHEKDYNRWYNTEHCPDVLRFPGALSARRYRKILGDDRYQYMTIYEFENKEALERYRTSDRRQALMAEYDAKFGDVSERDRAAYEQIWP